MDKLEWLSQVKRGILEYSILILISKNSMYGYELISKLNQSEALSTSEGTIYPLLRRLEKDSLIKSSWQDTTPGTPPRKYYSLTPNGREMLNIMHCEWGKLVDSIEQIKLHKE